VAAASEAPRNPRLDNVLPVSVDLFTQAPFTPSNYRTRIIGLLAGNVHAKARPWSQRPPR